MNLNGKQITLIVAAALGALTTSTAQLTELFGSEWAKDIISIAGLGSTILNIVIASISGQYSTVMSVQGMPGIEKIVINDKANPTLASIAVDPSHTKIETKPGDELAVQGSARKV